MRHRMYLSLIITLLLSTTARSQQPSSAYAFRVVAQPGMTIDGHLFTPDTVISSVALNDTGQIAFVAHWRDVSGSLHSAVFTPSRVLAGSFESVGGNYIVEIPADGHLAINAGGQVAFEAIYGEEPNLSEGWDGIFVDGHLALRRSQDAEGSPFTLTDDGQVMPGPQKPGAAPARPASAPQQGKPSLLDQLHMKQPKLPFGITIGPKGPAANQPRPAPDRLVPRPQLMNATSPFAAMRTNQKGQVLIPINFGTGGFILVLGTPMTDASRAR